ncbi:hypothetical protein [Streptomyces sp. NPDC000405]|uniref:hypothetical protein n=1 Tax=Streptomyces sp. NPDC000405 TaxID=3161033 RepID=UPI00398D5AA3
MRNGTDLAADAGCTSPSLAVLTATVLPWLAVILMTGLLAGAVVGWISRRGGDNPWLALRHGLLTVVASVGPLLAVLTLVVNLAGQCR